MTISRKRAILQLVAGIVVIIIVQLFAHAILHAEPGSEPGSEHSSEHSADAQAAYKDGQDRRVRSDLRGARLAFLDAINADRKWAEPHIAQAEVYVGLFNGVAAQA